MELAVSSIDVVKRVCVVLSRSALLTFQALSEDDRKLWMDVMDGKEPVSKSNLLILCSKNLGLICFSARLLLVDLIVLYLYMCICKTI